MNFAIDPHLSVYRLVERVQARSTLLSHRRTMSLVSREMENATIVDSARTRVFSSFQYMHKFLPQVERYRRLAQKAESVYVFGVPDVELPQIANITYVPLSPGDQLAKEWFLISYGEDYCSALATEELTHISDPDEMRQFKGIWTFDQNIVTILENWLTSLVDAHPMLLTDDTRRTARQQQLMSNTIARLSSTVVNAASTKLDTHELRIRDEIKTALSLHTSI